MGGNQKWREISTKGARKYKLSQIRQVLLPKHEHTSTSRTISVLPPGTLTLPKPTYTGVPFSKNWVMSSGGVKGFSGSQKYPTTQAGVDWRKNTGDILHFIPLWIVPLPSNDGVENDHRCYQEAKKTGWELPNGRNIRRSFSISKSFKPLQPKKSSSHWPLGTIPGGNIRGGIHSRAINVSCWAVQAWIRVCSGKS